MKKITTLVVLLLLVVAATYAQIRTISFTPYEGLQAREINGKAYTNAEWNSNLDGVKSAVPTLSAYTQLPRVGKLGRQLAPAQTIHFTEISTAAKATSGSYVGLNYIVSASWNLAKGNSASKMIFIKEDAEAIKVQMDSWKAGDINQPVIAQTKYSYNVGQQFVVGLYANESFSITLPDYVQFLSLEMGNQWGYVGRTWTKFFDYTYTVENNVLTVNLTPGQFMFYSSPKIGEESLSIPNNLLGNPDFSWENPIYGSLGNRLAVLFYKGYRTIGSINLKAIAPGDGYILGAQEGYIYVK